MTSYYLYVKVLGRDYHVSVSERSFFEVVNDIPHDVKEKENYGEFVYSYYDLNGEFIGAIYDCER